MEQHEGEWGEVDSKTIMPGHFGSFYWVLVKD